MKETDTLKEKTIQLVLPIAFQQFMLALVGASDAVMLGRLSQNSMSAVSLASQVTFVFNLFMAAFVIGENMFIAQYYGKKDYTGISKVFCLVLYISGIVAALFLLGTIFFSKGIMHFLTNDPELIRMGSEYLKCVGVSYLLSAISQVYLTFMKNCGAVNLSTVISSMTVILNIMLNAIFIFGLFGAPVLGIRGAALATVLATVVQMIWCIAYVMINKKRLRIRLLDRDPDLVKKFWGKVAPVLLNELIWGGGFTMYSVIMGHLGTDAVAANSIANISKNLVVCLCLGLGSAGSIIVGNELGADHFEEAKKAGRTLTRLSIVCGVLSGLFLLALSPVIVKLVNMTPTARGYLKGMLVMCSYYLVGKSVNSMTIGGIFPAGGDSKFGLFCDTVTLWCMTVPIGCLCAFILKLPVLGVYFVLNLDEIVKLPAVYRHYRKYGWLKNIT
ncbi:MAG: MATE family efflux transporter [Lachnospiraceae bacterium]|nr:MATE family efflux transporter [Lachnospiraceae bacterium]